MENIKKHKVVFIHPDLGIGGAERLVLDVAVALAEKGNEVSFVTNHFDKTHAFQELKDGQFPVRVVGNWIPRSICGICQALCAYLRMIFLSLVYVFFIRKEEKPDVYFIDQIPMAVPFIKLAGGKVIYYCHHPDLLASPPGGRLKKLYRMPINWLELKGTGLADVILVNSKYTASVFRKIFPQITKDICILYPTISASYQSKIENYTNIKNIHELVPSISSTENPVIFLSINRYHPAKNLELALSGFEALKDKISSNDWQRVYLIVAGGYDPQSAINAKYFTDLVTRAQEKDLITKVVFLKSLSDDLKVDLLLACNCLIYTPINEHFGIVPLEAMIAAKPVIACNSGGPCETVENEVTGFLCEPNGDSLAVAMSKILDKNNSVKMGLQGRKRLQKYFSHAVFVNSVNNVVNSIIGEELGQLNDSPVIEEEDVGQEEINSSEKKNEAETEKIPEDTEIAKPKINNDSAESKKKEKITEDDAKIEKPMINNDPPETKETNDKPEITSDNLSSQNETLIDIKNSEEKQEVRDQKSTVNDGKDAELINVKEKSPIKEELEGKTTEESVEKSPDKDIVSNEVPEFKRESLTGDKTEIPLNKGDPKTATAAFLKNETESNYDSIAHENVEVADEALVHNE